MSYSIVGFLSRWSSWSRGLYTPASERERKRASDDDVDTTEMAEDDTAVDAAAVVAHAHEERKTSAQLHFGASSQDLAGV